MRRRRRLRPSLMLPGGYAVGEDGPGTEPVEDLEALFRPHVEARIVARVAADRGRTRCTEEDARALGHLAASIALSCGKGIAAAIRAAKQTREDLLNPPELSSEEEAAVVAEFVADETSGLVEYWLRALHLCVDPATGLLDAGKVGDAMLPEGFPVTPEECDMTFIYLRPDDVLAVLRGVAAALPEGDAVPGAALAFISGPAVTA